MGEDRTGRPETTKPGVTVSEASALLGISAEAVRMRIKRGTLPAERRAGRVYVLLGSERAGARTTERTTDRADHAGHAYPQAEGLHRDFDPLTEELRDRVRYLERVLEEERAARTEERRRHDTLIAQLMQRIPEIEAPREPPGGPREEPSARRPPQSVWESLREEPERAEPRSTTQGAQEDAQRAEPPGSKTTAGLRSWATGSRAILAIVVILIIVALSVGWLILDKPGGVGGVIFALFAAAFLGFGWLIFGSD